MFERFTEQARLVVVFAQEEARTLRHNYIGTEHLLLGLLREDSAAVRALDPFAVTREEVHAQVARIVGLGDEVATGQIPFTPRAKKVLELSLREALDNNESYIGPKHIMLGLVREGDGVGARILMDFAPLENIRLAVLDVGAEEEFKPETPPVAQEVIDEIARARGDKEKAIEEHEFARAATLRNREARLLKAARDLQRAWVEEEPPAVASTAVAYRRASRFSGIPKGATSYGPRTIVSALLVGWTLFGVALGVGLLIGWAIWG